MDRIPTLHRLVQRTEVPSLLFTHDDAGWAPYKDGHWRVQACPTWPTKLKIDQHPLTLKYFSHPALHYASSDPQAQLYWNHNLSGYIKNMYPGFSLFWHIVGGIN